MNSIERRYTLIPVETRAKGGERRSIGGYAAMFDRPSQNLGGFIEVVRSSFFNKSRGDGWPDVLARYNHNDNMLLGTIGGGTLRLEVDAEGLSYEVDVPQARADVLELVERGDVRKSSFAFRLRPGDGDEWGLSDQGFPQRDLLSGQLVDVAPVNSPAYENTSVDMRSAAIESLARQMSADVEEVRSLADQNALTKFFRRTDGPAAKPQVFGTAALLQLKGKRDPSA